MTLGNRISPLTYVYTHNTRMFGKLVQITRGNYAHERQF